MCVYLYLENMSYPTVIHYVCIYSVTVMTVAPLIIRALHGIHVIGFWHLQSKPVVLGDVLNFTGYHDPVISFQGSKKKGKKIKAFSTYFYS